jgi:hypothetical protein
LNCVIECAPYQGPEIIRLARLLARGGEIPRSMYYDVRTFTEWDDLSGLEARGY